MKRTFIAWAPYHRRSELLAQYFNASMHFVFSGQSGRLLKPPVKYLAQALKATVRYPRLAWQTWRVLRDERPDVIFVQNPPIFCVLLAYFYSRRYGARFIIDSHTGAFLSRNGTSSAGRRNASILCTTHPSGRTGNRIWQLFPCIGW